MILGIAIITSGRLESTRKVVADVIKLKKSRADLFSNITLYSPAGFHEIEGVERYEFTEKLTFDEKILRILQNSTSDYLWIVNDHSSISSEIITQFEAIEFNMDYILISDNYSIVEELKEVKDKGCKWIPLFGTFINNNIFNRKMILSTYESNLKNYNGSMLNFVISCADALTNDSNVAIIHSSAIGYGAYKIEEEYKDSWQSSFKSYLNVALWFSLTFDDLFIKTNGVKAYEVKKIIKKYNLLTILNLCKLSAISGINNTENIYKLFNSNLYRNSWGYIGIFIFKIKLNKLIGNVVMLCKSKK